jgi:hypothetical protein
VNEPNPIIVADEVQSDASAERPKRPTAERPNEPAAARPHQSEDEWPRQSRRAHRKPTAINLTFCVVAIFWLAIMWAIVEMMLLEIG